MRREEGGREGEKGEGGPSAHLHTTWPNIQCTQTKASALDTWTEVIRYDTNCSNDMGRAIKAVSRLPLATASPYIRARREE